MRYLDMLTRLGIGSAHPGGFSKTLEQLEHYPIQVGSRVLEAGCGTGRSSCLLAHRGCDVTAIDIRPEMLSKAQKRAQQENVDIKFVEADACNLPFAAGTFDVVFVESVSIFMDTRQAVSEYARVLKTGGILYEREGLSLMEMPHEIRSAFSKVYDIHELFSAEEWITLLKSNGFGSVELCGPYKAPTNMWEDLIKYPDSFQQVDSSIFFDPEIWELSLEYADLNMKYQDYYGYGVFIAVKGEPEEM